MRASIALMAVSFVLALAGHASAESIAYKDPRFGGQTVFLRIEYRSGKSCEYFAGASRGAPHGAVAQMHQLPITVVVARDGPCKSERRRLRMNKTVFAGLQHYDVKLFFVAPSGRLLATESMAITER